MQSATVNRASLTNLFAGTQLQGPWALPNWVCVAYRTVGEKCSTRSYSASRALDLECELSLGHLQLGRFALHDQP